MKKKRSNEDLTCRVRILSIVFALAMLFLYPSFYIIPFYFQEDNLVEIELVIANEMKDFETLISIDEFKCVPGNNYYSEKTKKSHHQVMTAWNRIGSTIWAYARIGIDDISHVNLKNNLFYKFWFTQGTRIFGETNRDFLANERSRFDAYLRLRELCLVSREEGNEKGPSKKQIEETKTNLVNHLAGYRARILAGVDRHKSNLLAINLVGLFFIALDALGFCAFFCLFAYYRRRNKVPPKKSAPT